MDWIVYIVVALVAAGASYYSAQRAQNKASQLKPGEFSVPTATEGRKIPKLFGTRLIKDVNVLAYGGAWTEPIKK